MFDDHAHPVTFLALVLAALTVYRLSRLVAVDVITEGLRARLRRGFEGWAVTLLHCAWCISIWIAVPVVLLTAYAGEWWRWVMVGFATSAVAGFLTERE